MPDRHTPRGDTPDVERACRTPLYSAHVAAGARMATFAGYDMPIQYAEGVLFEHRWTRQHAGLFDVSHMGPAFLRLAETSGDADADHRAIASLIEPLICGDIVGLKPGQLRYTLLLNGDGGIVDDLMVGRPREPDRQGELYIVVNAGTKDGDFARLEAAATGRAEVVRADDGGLIAVQGPDAVAVVEELFPGAAQLRFLTWATLPFEDDAVVVSRSGYTGEDGFELLVSATTARRLWDRLAADARVKAVGLGARDSLRLEAGLPLYGHDLDESLSPVQAALSFAVSKRRRTSGDLPGAARIERETAGGVDLIRLGLKVLSGPPAREGAEIADNGRVIGRVTSGGFSPTLKLPIALGYAPPEYQAPGTALQVIVRGKAQPAEVTALPFVPHRYVRKTRA